MQNNVDKVFEYLSWDSDKDTQAIGMQIASQIKHLSILIMPVESKSTWENCAKVLVSKSDEALQPYLLKLFEWLKDINWPGAELIYNRLLRVELDDLIPAYQYSLSVAKQTQDRVWEAVLNDFWKDRRQRGQGDGSPAS